MRSNNNTKNVSGGNTSCSYYLVPINRLSGRNTNNSTNRNCSRATNYTSAIDIIQGGISYHTCQCYRTNCHYLSPYFLILARRARGSNFLGSSDLSDLSEAAVALRTSAILSESLAMSNAASMYASDLSATSRPETSLTYATLMPLASRQSVLTPTSAATVTRAASASASALAALTAFSISAGIASTLAFSESRSASMVSALALASSASFLIVAMCAATSGAISNS
ncbi:hypothetical protein [Escherichia phage IMM-001]|nr:hypothetical protein [Escherichia phage IMM-001]